MKQVTEKELYFEIRYKERVTDYKAVSNSYRKFLGKKITEDDARKKYSNKGGIDQFICEIITKKVNKDFNLKKLCSIREDFKTYHKYYTQYFNEGRKKFFNNFNGCLQWFEEQNNKCGYCGITQEELDKVTRRRNGNFTLNNKSKRSKATLEIEKKDSVKGYEADNMILACPPCNNAKSNLISEEDWRNYFVDAMRSYYEELLQGKLKNSKPKKI